MVLLLLLGAFALVVFEERIEGRLERLIEQRVSEATGGSLEIGALDVHWTRLSIDVVAFRLVVPSQGEGEPLRVEVDRASVGVALRGLPGLAAGRLHLSSVDAEGVRVGLDQGYIDAVPRGKDKDRAFDVRVDRIAIEQGEFRYEDRTLPLDVEARDASIHGVWSAYRQSLTGTVTASADLGVELFRKPLPVSVAASYRLTEQRLEVFEARASAPGVEAELDEQTISWDGPTLVTASASLRADLDQLAPWLAADIDGLGGMVEGDVSWSVGGGPVQVRGRLEARPFSIGPLRLSSADLAVTVDPGSVRIDIRSAEGLGGTLVGRVDLDYRDGLSLAIEARGEEIAASAVFAVLDVPMPLAGTGSVDARWSGSPDELETWTADGTFDFRPVKPIANRIPVTAAGTFAIDAGRVSVHTSGAELAATVLDVDVEQDLLAGRGTIRLDGHTRDATETQRATFRILREVEVELPEELRSSLRGSGRVTSTIQVGESGGLELSLDLIDGAYGEETFDRLALELGMVGDHLTVSRFDASDDGWYAHGSLELDLAGPHLIAGEGEAVEIPLGLLFRLAGVDLPDVAGTVSGAVVVRGGPSGIEGTGRVRVRNVVWQGERIDEATAAFVAREDRAVFTDLAASGPAVTLAGDLEVDLAGRRATLGIDTGSVELGELAALGALADDLDALLEVEGDLELTPESILGTLAIRGDAWSWGERAIPPLGGAVRFHADGAEIDLSSVESEDWTLVGGAAWEDGVPLDLTLTLDRFGVDVIRDPDGPSVWARLTGVFRLEGPANDPGALIVDGTLAEATVRAGTRTLRVQDPLPVRFEAGAFALGPVTFSGRGSDLELACSFDADTGVADVGVRGHVDLGVLTAMIPDATASGRMEVDLRLSGRPEALATTGSARLEGGRLRFLGFPQAFESIGFEFDVVDNEARIRDVHALLGGGELRGVGGVLLDGFGLDSYRLELAGANVMVAYPDDFRAVYEGEVVLRGDAHAAELGGRMHMLRGEYTQEMDAASLLGGGSREYSTSESFELPTRVFLDIDVTADGNVWMRNDLVEVETDFDLSVGGDIDRPEVLGRIRVFEGGELRFRDVDYRVLDGTVDFVDIGRIDPYLNLRATTRVREYEIELHIEGRVDRFDYELTSNPTLTQQDIIALLTTGSTLEELSARGGGGSFTGDLAAGYFAGALTDRFEKQLQEMLRVERLQISPLLVRGSGDPTARVTVGKEVANDVLLIYSTELGNAEGQLYEIEWRASRKFRLTAGRDTLGGIGGEVLFSDRFWWRKPPSKDYGRKAGIRRAIGSADGFVGTVRIEGAPAEDVPEIRSRIPVHDGDGYRRSVLFEGAQRVREWYVKQDRVEARVEVDAQPRPDDPTRFDIVYRVDRGPRIAVELEGASGRLQRRRIMNRLRTLWTETVFTSELLRDSAAEIEEFYRERGYYTAEVRVVREQAGDPDRADVRFRIESGPQVRVVGVEVTGNRAISDERIAKQMLTRTGGLKKRLLVPGTLDDDVRAIRNLYRDQGYLDVRLARPRIQLGVDGQTAHVSLPIEEGDPVQVGEVVVEEPPAGFDPNEIVSWSGLNPGDTFTHVALLSAESGIRAAFDVQGYPDVRAEARAERDGDRMNVRLTVVPGGRRVLADVEIVGNFTTKPRIITRELALALGDPISRAAILKTQHALYGLGIFRNVTIAYVPIAGAGPEDHRLRIEVEESPPFGVTIGAGYDSEARFKGSFGVGHANVGGRDRTLSLQGRVSSIEERVQALAEEPRLFGRKLPTLLSVLKERLEHPEFTEKRLATAFRVEKRHPERRSSVFLRYNFQRVDLLDVQEDAIDSIQDQKLEDLILGDVSTSWIRSTRDDPFSPSRGSLATAELRWFADAFLSEAEFVKAFGQWNTVHTHRNGQAQAGAVRVGLAEPYGGTTAVPLSERFFAGGDSTIRGFPRDGVAPSGGEAMLILNYEWRVPIWRAFRGAVFYDVGNVYPTVGDFDPTDLRHVLGAGLRIETPIGPLRFEYGHKLDRREGESAGEFFVAIGSPF